MVPYFKTSCFVAVDVAKTYSSVTPDKSLFSFLIFSGAFFVEIIGICYVFRKPFGNVNRWFTTVVNQPQVKQVVGAVTLCEKMAQFDAKKFAEFQVSQTLRLQHGTLAVGDAQYG
jgi:hypothetical protein